MTVFVCLFVSFACSCDESASEIGHVRLIPTRLCAFPSGGGVRVGRTETDK